MKGSKQEPGHWQVSYINFGVALTFLFWPTTAPFFYFRSFHRSTTNSSINFIVKERWWFARDSNPQDGRYRRNLGAMAKYNFVRLSITNYCSKFQDSRDIYRYKVEMSLAKIKYKISKCKFGTFLQHLRKKIIGWCDHIGLFLKLLVPNIWTIWSK